jgi:hypothetical protein
LLSIKKLQGQDTHTDQIAPMNSLKTFGNNRLHAKQQRDFGSPVPRAPGPILLAGNNDENHTSFRIFSGSFKDRHDGAGREEFGYATFTSRNEEVL